MKTIVTETENWFSQNRETILKAILHLDEEEMDDILNNRDTNPFDEDWVAADKAVEQHKQQFAQTERTAITAFSDEMRKDFFQSVIKATRSSDLAAYISEDIGLICNALSTKCMNEFIFSLIHSYLSGKVPCNGKSATKCDRIVLGVRFV